MTLNDLIYCTALLKQEFKKLSVHYMYVPNTVCLHYPLLGLWYSHDEQSERLLHSTQYSSFVNLC